MYTRGFIVTEWKSTTQEPLQEASPQRVTAEDDGDHCSSYATGESEEEGDLEIQTMHAPNNVVERLDGIRTSMAAVDITHNAIMNKLTLVEKVVMPLQEDMTWVREDLGVVHEIVEKFAEHVSMRRKTTTEVEGVREDRSPNPCAWGTWKDEAHAKDHDRARTTSITEDERILLCDDEPRHMHGAHEAASSIRETQFFNSSKGIYNSVTSLAEENGMGEMHSYWETGKKTRQRDVEDVLEDGTQQMELSCDGTQVRTHAPSRSMWVDFAFAIRDLPSLVADGGNDDEGWVRAKRAHGNCIEYAAN